MKLPKLGLKKTRNIFIWLISAIFLLSVGFTAGIKGYQIEISRPGKVNITRTVPPDKNVDFSLFWKVWDTLSVSYFDKNKLVPGKMVYGAIKGMVEAVGDPYTIFLPPSENKISQEDLQGNFEGIGIQIGFKGNQLAVIAPLPGTPADKAGIKAGDYIVGIKDENKKIDRGTVGITLPEAVEAIRGPQGTKVTLALLREGSDKPLIVDVARESIDVPSVILTFTGENDSIANIKLLKFGAETDGEWNKAVADIVKKPGIKGIILDLRNNPGGYLQSAVDIASEFVNTGTTVVIEEKANGEKFEFKSQNPGKLTNRKIAVLINGGSASASEILAGALRDILKTSLIGEKSFGKGTIQEPQQLDNGSGLHITIAKWLTPASVWVNEKGLEPDVKILDKADTPADEQVDEAIKILGNE